MYIISNDLVMMRHRICTLSSLFNDKGCLPGLANPQAMSPVAALPPAVILGTDIDALTTPTKIIYSKINDSVNSLLDTTTTHWHDNGYVDKDTHFNWKDTNRLPTSKKEGDNQV